MIPTLAFIPADDVNDAFEILTVVIRHQYGDKANDVFDFFEGTYIIWFRRNTAQVITV